MATLLILAVVFFVVGIHKNDQITGLEQHGVAVQATVTGCVGLLGGSGSNVAGYRCWGTFTVDGHRYTKDIPGTVLRPIGSRVPVIADSADPGLISPLANWAPSTLRMACSWCLRCSWSHS